MISYKEYEKAVFEWLMQKHKKDSSFTFSLRKKGSVGAEEDYFIGREKSKYFGMTFWNIPTGGYPGSTGGCITLIFSYSKDKYSYKFEFVQGKNYDDLQNKSIIELLLKVKKAIESSMGFSYISPDENKKLILNTKQIQSSYTSLETMLADVDKGLKILIPAVNKAIAEIKLDNPEFIGYRLTLNEFNKMQNKLEKRLKADETKERKTDKSTLIRENYSNWLKGTESSNKINSYLRALDILSEQLNKDIYLEKNTDVLTLLYKDLIKNQGDEKSKYYYEKAPSYGNSGFYSASVKAFIDFLKEDPIIITKRSKELSAINQILYGPPGTGKTYATISEAVAIVNPDFNRNTERYLLKQEYSRLVKNGNIAFTTFHQSMSYEDFVEGIKPVLDSEEKDVSYLLEDGIFKEISDRAKGIKGEIKTDVINVDFKSCNYFKMSVGGKNRKDIHDWCIANNKIAIGYGGDKSLDLITSNDWEIYKTEFQDKFSELVEKSSYNITATYYFKYSIKIGDVVLVSLGNHIIDAIGVVKGNYEYVVGAEIPYHHFREVEWIATGLEANPNLFIDKNISQQSIYQFNNDDIKVDYLEKLNTLNKYSNTEQNHVLIIDEINRGNVSAIFGELITLLEPDKRLGKEEELKLILPYSKREFGVPTNLHIIGTMNTADRSVESLDTALRRRFEFKEMMPDYTVIEKEEVEGIKLANVLNTINERIELLLDRDHTIGHSYFIGLDKKKKLANVFNNKIVPLLQEYFYGDYGKIGLVLGDGFVEEKKNKDLNFSSFKYEGKEDFIVPTYHLKKVTSENIIEAVKNIFNTDNN